MIQNSDDFNKKWYKNLETNFYGMAIENLRVLQYMDQEFEKEVAVNPDFQYAQIKLKFGTARVYTNSSRNTEWENQIDLIMKESRSETIPSPPLT